jgi:hypothetical protein
MNIVLYEDSGFIVSVIEDASDEMVDDQASNELNVTLTEQPVGPNTHCIVAGQPVALKHFSGLATALVGRTITIGGIPSGTIVIWPDGVATEERGELICDVSVADRYIFIFTHPRYFEHTEVVDVP